MGTTGRSLGNVLRDLEHQFFFARTRGEATPEGFIAWNTWIGWRAIPETDGVPKQALQSSFDHLTQRLQEFLKTTIPLTCEAFDRYHESQVESLREFLESYRHGVSVRPKSAGEFHGCSYGAYAKIVNLAYTHWCFLPRRNKDMATRRFDPASRPDLRKCLHVPLDSKVLMGIQGLIDRGDFPSERIPIPEGKAGMGLISSRRQYMDIQLGTRAVVSEISSRSFKGHLVSPLAFEGFWQST